MLGYTIKDIQRAVYPPSFERGVAYQRSNRVNGLRIAQGGRLITGTVQGDERDPYRVQVHIRYQDNHSAAIHGACSCAVQTNCKHVAALLLQALESDEQSPAEGTESGETRAASDYTRAWFDRVSRHLAPKSESRKGGAPEHLIYVLAFRSSNDGPRLAVQIHVVRRLKNGGYGKALPYSGTRTARYVTDVDRQLLQWLEAFGDRGEVGVTVTGKHGAFLIRELVDTGRCHWLTKDNPALQPGPERAARFEWHLLDDGGQELRCAGSSCDVVLPLEPPWYIDRNASQCGPLATQIPDRVAADLATAPRLSIEQARTGNALLEQIDPARFIPRPRLFESVSERAAAPVPCLRLFIQSIPVRREHRWEFDASDVLVELAHLSFDYDGVTTDLNDSRQTLTRIDGRNVVRYMRDFAREQEALKHVEDWHWTPLELQLAFNVPSAHLMDFTIQGTDRQERLERFSIDGVPALRALGWRVEIAPDYPYRIVEEIGGWFAHLDDDAAAQEFDIDLGVTIDGHRVSLLGNFLNLLRRRQRHGRPPDRINHGQSSLVLHLEDGRLLALPQERVDAVLNALAEFYEMQPKRDTDRIRLSKPNAAQLRDMELALGDGAQWDGAPQLREISQRLRDFHGIEEVTPPAGLQTALRAYQQQGLNWLQFLSRYGLGGILADDMGLGKTVQALAHLLVEKESGRAARPSLVVAPTSLMANWDRETRRFAPALRTIVLHGDQRKKHFSVIPECDVVFTTYPLLLRDQDALLEQEYHLLILDEAQNIKNVRAKASAVVRRIRARHRVCLTGTPMENHLGELWSLFDFLMPGFLGDERRFQRLYRVPIEKDGDRDRQHSLSKRIAPFMLRRTKQEVVRELPPKTEMVRTIALTGAQRELYESVRVLLHEKIRDEITKNGFERSSVVILDALLRLRQLCCDPRLLKWESLKAATQKANSAKLEMLMDMLPSLVEEGRRVLLFSQFTSMLDLIKTELNDAGIRFAILTGETRNRAAPIEAFQDGKVPVFLISLKAGGTGLNLTAADTVIHYDPWWNPAVENQATDRAYRIGQDKPVFVYKLVTAGTVEEAILELQARKQSLADGLYSENGEGVSALTVDDLNALFAPAPES